jgi:hypothetical protein
MTSLFSLAALALIASLPALAQDLAPAPVMQVRPPTGAVVIMADDGGMDHVTSRTLRSLVASELRKHGLTVSDDPRFAGVHPVDAALADALRAAGAQRLFVLRVGGRLGNKVPLALEEDDPRQLSTVFAADLVATGMDEADRNLRRLVEAVLERKQAADTAGMTTVTNEEKRPFQKKPAERFWALGFPFGFNGSVGRTYGTPFGFSAAYMIEAEHARVDFDLLGETHGSSSTFFTGILAHWVVSDRQVSPYVGAGLGYLWLNGSDGTGGTRSAGGMGAAAEVGVEAMRLQTFRIMAGVQALLPLYDASPISLSWRITPLAHVRFCF